MSSPIDGTPNILRAVDCEQSLFSLVRRAPDAKEIAREFFFRPGFFRVSFDGLSERETTRSLCEQSLFYRFLLFCFIFYYTEKEVLDKSDSFFEVAVAPALRLAIPVYCRQTGFSSASINFQEKPMVETEPTRCKENMAAKGLGKEIVRKRLTILCLELFL